MLLACWARCVCVCCYCLLDVDLLLFVVFAVLLSFLMLLDDEDERAMDVR